MSVLARDRREHDGARALYEKMLGYASPLDLRGGDQRSGRELGNLPARNFIHSALSTPMHVIRADLELAAAQPSLDSRREVPAT